MIYQRLGNFYLAVPVGDSSMGFPNYIELNGSCQFIARRISDGCTMDSIVAEFAERFSIPSELARKDVEAVINGFCEMGVMEKDE